MGHFIENKTTKKTNGGYFCVRTEPVVWQNCPFHQDVKRFPPILSKNAALLPRYYMNSYIDAFHDTETL